MLVLSAACTSGIPWLCDLIPKDKLKELISRTVRFLARLRYTSNTARTDIEILQAIQKHLFNSYDDVLRGDGSLSMHASFSSDL